MSDPFGTAIRDWYRDEQAAPLVQRDGEEAVEHPIESFYFGTFDESAGRGAWLAARLSGPLLDVGAGVGRDVLFFQERFETVALERSPALVETMRERGVVDARCGDMFTLRETFDAGRFASVLSYGTQLGLAGSMDGLRRFLVDLADVTTDDATAVVDGYDPSRTGTRELLGFRSDPTPGLAYRVFHFEYDRRVGETLLFRLFSPDRLREAAVPTPWTVEEIRRGDDGDGHHYLAALTKAESRDVGTGGAARGSDPADE